MSWLEIAIRAVVIFIGFCLAIQCTEQFSWMRNENQFITKLERFNSFIFGCIQLTIGALVMLLGFSFKEIYG